MERANPKTASSGQRPTNKPLAIVGVSTVAVLLVLVARVSLGPKVCFSKGVANLKSLRLIFISFVDPHTSILETAGAYHMK